MLTAIVVALSCAPQASAPIAIHVFTRVESSGLTDANQRQRLQSVVDLRKGLAKKKSVKVVDAPGPGVLLLEVLEKGRPETDSSQAAGAGQAPGTAGAATPKQKWPAVHVALRIGDYAGEIKGSGKRWRWAADAIADAVDQWVKENRALLPR